MQCCSYNGCEHGLCGTYKYPDQRHNWRHLEQHQYGSSNYDGGLADWSNGWDKRGYLYHAYRLQHQHISNGEHYAGSYKRQPYDVCDANDNTK